METINIHGYNKDTWIQSVPNLVFSGRKFLQWPFTFFLKDSFSLNFPISRENRNLEPITIRYDVGHPVDTWIHSRYMDTI